MTGRADSSGGDGDRNGAQPRPVLIIPRAIRDEIVERARDGRPREVCGVFGGTFETDESRVRSQYPAANVAADPRTRYRIDPEEQLEIFERLEDRGEEIAGFYHSHPRGPPRPSATDVDAATWSDRSYLIISLEPFTVGSWRWRSGGSGGESEPDDDGGFERERIVLE